MDGFLRCCDVVRKTTFEVSGDAEVLGFLGLGSSLTLEWGLGMGGQSCGFRLQAWVETYRVTLSDRTRE